MTPVPPSVPLPGQIIAGKYEIERVVGTGGMGIVLAARHTQLPQRVAIKFMRAEVATDDKAAGRFLREARSAAALSSEHVCRVLDVGTLETGAPYLVMEYLDGIDLGQVLLQHGPMRVPDAVGSVLQACEAIAEAHAIGIVHRDLKPANLFLSNRRDGATMVKVLDFGISKVVDFNTIAAANLTASGLLMGSPAYMSPEQVRSAKAVDARTDIWALGVILYELLTGARPFAGETVGEILAAIVSETPRPIRQYRNEVPERLAAAISRCLDRRVERRIQDVAELASEIALYSGRNGENSLERILRWRSAPAGNPPGGATLTAPPGAALPSETSRAWLRSSRSSRREARPSRWKALALMAGGAASVVLVGAYALNNRRPVASAHDRPSAASSLATSIPPASRPAAEGPVAAAPAGAILADPSDAAVSTATPPAHSAPVAPSPRHVSKPTPAHATQPSPKSLPSNETELY